MANRSIARLGQSVEMPSNQGRPLNIVCQTLRTSLPHLANLLYDVPICRAGDLVSDPFYREEYEGAYGYR